MLQWYDIRGTGILNQVSISKFKIPRHVLLGAGFIIVATLAVYMPAINGGFIWDDPEHITNNHTLRNVDGLIEIWTVPQSIPQWYPLVHTTFWIEYQLKDLRPRLYHLDNVLLHITSALLLWRLLTVLKVPGAWLAAAIFALHPVHVESVAWITERKNVLSCMFYLLTVLAYWRYIHGGRDRRAEADSSPPRNVSETKPKSLLEWRYILALTLFVAALLSKTVTATLPAALLVLLWWKNGRLRWADVMPLIPFFIVGIGMGLFTAWLEVHHVGASSDRIVELQLSLLDRLTLAGRVICFYAAKLVYPYPLMFIYRQWTVDWHVWWQWIFSFGVLGLLIALVVWRNRIGRGPAAALMLYCGTLFPVLGFFNVYPFRFSYVADHFQYHASIGMIALAAVGLCRLLSRGAWAVLVPLIVLTVLRTPAYKDAETIWRDTLAKNPNSWMVNTNLAHIVRGRALASNDPKDWAEADELYEKALKLAPHIHDTHANVGMSLGRRGDIEGALNEFNEALKINPNFAPAYYGIAQVYQKRGDMAAALQNYQEAIKYAPNYSEAYLGLGIVLEQLNQYLPALEAYREAIIGMPEDAEAQYNLGSCSLRLGMFAEAAFHLSEAVRIRPEWAQAWTNLGITQFRLGNEKEAVRSLRRALDIDPKLEPALVWMQRILR